MIDDNFCHDRIAIQETIIRAANAMDMKDWAGLRDCLLDDIHTDYSDLRGDPPSIISADDYVEKRKAALSPLKTQHLSTNHLISIEGDTASCSSHAAIFRWRITDDGVLNFNTHCHYEHKLQRTASGWKISAIKQVVFWNDGDPSIHSGAKST